MSVIEKIKNFFKKLFSKKVSSHKKKNLQVKTIKTDETLFENDINAEEIIKSENIEKFKIHNIIFEELNYLEQYIKTFSLNFPNEYSYYLSTIQKYREDYEKELHKYNLGWLGELTFAIDPEQEAERRIAIEKLKKEIINFVEYVYNFSIYQNKFSKLCSKLNQFYNALLDTKENSSTVIIQLEKAQTTMNGLVNEVKILDFFNKDSRKREIIFNHIVYGEYIFLKSYLRCSCIQTLDEYKNNISKCYSLFIDNEYTDLLFKFFIEDLENCKECITTQLLNVPTYNQILCCLQDLQEKLRDYSNLNNPEFLYELLTFENTVNNIADSSGISLIIPLPKSITSNTNLKSTTKEDAITVLSMLESNKAKILCMVISNFKVDISWKEFYFLCKIFELHNDVIEISKDTLFNIAATKFTEFTLMYSKYSDKFIAQEKQKLLNYNGSKSKKYVLLLDNVAELTPIISQELKKLKLDFLISENSIYINNAYFNGFKNLQINFGKYKLTEEIL